MSDTSLDYSIPERKGGVLRKFLVIFVPIFIIVMFFVAAQVIIALTKTPKEKKRNFNTLAVIADYAKIEDVQLQVRTQGEARPQIEIDLVPQVGGKIVYVSPNFVEGGIFRKGETLVRVEDDDFKVAVIRAEAGVAQAQQVLVREKAEGEIARQDYAELGRGEPTPLALREPQQAQAQAALRAAEADLQASKLNLSRTEVKAPFSGRVRSKTSDIGQFVSPGSRLGRIFSKDIVEVRLALSDDQLAKLDLPLAFVANDRASAPKVDLSAQVAGKTRHWEGRIMRTDAAYDTQTRALFAIAEVFDPYGAGASEDGVPLAPGLFVDADISGKSFENVIVIPRDGLRPQDEVYIVDNVGQAEIRKVSVLDAGPERALLTSGVGAGELVVLSPMERSRVEITLKVLDVNDPENVLVDPPKPDWMVEAEAEDAADAKASEGDKKKKRRWGKASDEDDGAASENSDKKDEAEGDPEDDKTEEN
ncbi:MexE family multidrug efflux RND transporter periplasmic adaptor subunit [Litorimonas cladophorae]|uniref:MexE family multidrug efflux RND transporter periplasmic adaptor subunit n=1 Tax=Litorimonas cladophorae TaxID=1220491 RepID=A0A918KPN7_9PROT|nr:efflux RND transporter periplasmic adaptor subunit [Litorimonas cladophorae]GGX71706.1 MexE family multidrug efflux RND transporter periplasmic adaptor subunit [Litorimonas cladophorae]